MKNNKPIILAIVVLTLAALACQTLSGGGDAESLESPVIEIPTIEVPEFSEPEFLSDEVILSDDFSSSQWGTGTDVDSAVEYVDDALNFIVFTENFFVWSTPDAEDYKNVHLEVTVINNGTDRSTAFGLVCNMQSGGMSGYYVAMTPGGKYAIAKATTGETDLFLTNNDKWADSDLIPENADSYRIGMDCGNGSLALYVDGQLIDSVTDASYTSGSVAVFAWSGEEVGVITNVSFDDFKMTTLP